VLAHRATTTSPFVLRLCWGDLKLPSPHLMALLLVSTKKGEPSEAGGHRESPELRVFSYSKRPRWIGLELSQSGKRIHVDPWTRLVGVTAQGWDFCKGFVWL
jgi:hypothetical protein